MVILGILLLFIGIITSLTGLYRKNKNALHIINLDSKPRPETKRFLREALNSNSEIKIIITGIILLFIGLVLLLIGIFI